MYYETAEKLLEFIRKSPTAFHAVDTMKKTLAGHGFQELSEKELWSLTPGGNYMVTRNNSALIAFSIPEKRRTAFTLWQVTAILRLLRLKKILRSQWKRLM